MLSKGGVKNAGTNIIQEFDKPHQTIILQAHDTPLVLFATKDFHNLTGKIGRRYVKNTEFFQRIHQWGQGNEFGKGISESSCMVPWANISLLPRWTHEERARKRTPWSTKTTVPFQPTLGLKPPVNSVLVGGMTDFCRVGRNDTIVFVGKDRPDIYDE